MKVLIRVTRRTEYASIVEMSEEQFKRIQAELDGSTSAIRRKAEHEANELIDVHDWQDDELCSVDEFKEFKDEQEEA